MPKSRVFVGLKPGLREVFRFDREPTFDDGLPYNAVIGPFHTVRGAKFMVHFGEGNPHCRCVDDAERLGRLYYDEVEPLPKVKRTPAQAA